MTDLIKKYKCIKCGIEEVPIKFMRKKNFLCSSCKVIENDIQEVLNNDDILEKENIADYLIQKGYNISPKGILYKYYNKLRVSLNTACGSTLLLIADNNENMCFTDSSIIKYLPKEAILDLKKVINTIEYLWNKEK